MKIERGSKRTEFLRSCLQGLSPDVERGRKNQNRAICIAEGMVRDGIYQRVKRATKKQDKEGVDFWLYPNNGDYRIPIQVKSSVNGAVNFRLHRDDPEEVAVFVVNDFYSDIELRGKPVEQVVRWMRYSGHRLMEPDLQA